MFRFLTKKEPVVRACLLLSCSLLATFFFSGCGLFDPEDSDTVIEVGSTRVTLSQLKKDMEYFSGDLSFPLQRQDQAKELLVQRIIEHYLILEYGKKKGIALSEDEFEEALNEIRKDYPGNSFEEALLRGYVDFEVWKRRLREMLLVEKIVKRISEQVPPPGFQETKAYFDAHQKEFTTPPSVRYRQIVLDDKEEAEGLLERVKAGEDFGELARAHSKAPEAEKGGEVGWVPRGLLDESLEKVLFSLQPREVGPVTRTPYGYHLFQVLGKRPEGPGGLPQLIGEIEDELYRKAKESHCKNQLRLLRDRITVKVNEQRVHALELP